VSAPWASPDARRTVTGTAFGRPYEHSEAVAPPVAADLRAGLLAVAVTVLLGAPVGLLWAALAPHAEVVLTGTRVQLAETYSGAFVAADACYLAAVAVAGLVGGLVARRCASAHGPAVVVGLTVGGIVAAYVAAVVGEQVGSTAGELVAAGAAGRQELALQLRSAPAMVGWPVASLLAHVVATMLRDRS
jgi:hypothetical protein